MSAPAARDGGRDSLASAVAHQESVRLGNAAEYSRAADARHPTCNHDDVVLLGGRNPPKSGRIIRVVNRKYAMNQSHKPLDRRRLTDETSRPCKKPHLWSVDGQPAVTSRLCDRSDDRRTARRNSPPPSDLAVAGGEPYLGRRRDASLIRASRTLVLRWRYRRAPLPTGAGIAAAGVIGAVASAPTGSPSDATAWIVVGADMISVFAGGR